MSYLSKLDSLNNYQEFQHCFKYSLLSEGHITTAQLKLGSFNLGLLRSSYFDGMCFGFNLKESKGITCIGNLKIANLLPQLICKCQN